MTQEIKDPENRILKIGSRVRIHANAKGTCWEYGFIADIKGTDALINYGTPQHPIFGMGIKIKLSDLEVLE